MEASVVAVPPRWVAYRSGSSTIDALGDTIRELLCPIYAAEGVAGTPYARYLDWRALDCDLQAGVLLRERVAPSADICVDLYSACAAVRVEYWGRYDGRIEAHAACAAFIQAGGLVQGGPMWEVFDGPPDEQGNAKVIVYCPIEQAASLG